MPADQTQKYNFLVGCDPHYIFWCLNLLFDAEIHPLNDVYPSSLRVCLSENWAPPKPNGWWCSSSKQHWDSMPRVWGNNTSRIVGYVYIYISIPLDPHSIPVMLRFLVIRLKQLHFESFFIFKSQIPWQITIKPPFTNFCWLNSIVFCLIPAFLLVKSNFLWPRTPPVWWWKHHFFVGKIITVAVKSPFLSHHHLPSGYD